MIGDGGCSLEEPVELAVVEESLPFLTTLAWAAAEAAESFKARSFLEAERVGACFLDIVWAKETGLFALLAFFSDDNNKYVLIHIFRSITNVVHRSFECQCFDAQHGRQGRQHN